MAIRNGVPAIKILRGWRFRESDLQRWINSLVRLPQNNITNGGPGPAYAAKQHSGTPRWLVERMRHGKQ
jgi:hypothetical protein